MGVLLGDLVPRMLSVSSRRRNGQDEARVRRQGASPMVSSTGAFRLRYSHGSEIGIPDHGDGRQWPEGQQLLATAVTPHTASYLLAIPGAVLAGGTLTAYLARVAP